jgi:hypothetical protein
MCCWHRSAHSSPRNRAPHEVCQYVHLALITTDIILTPSAESGAASVTWSSVEANTGIICASLLCIKPLVVKLFPNLLSSQQPLRRNLPMITGGESEGSTWTCSTYVAADGRYNISGSGGQEQPPDRVINVMFETMQTTEVDSRRNTVVSSNDSRRSSTPWEKA